MADVDGEWDCVTQTPMGEQRATMTVRRDGDRFAGRMSGAQGAVEVTDGRVDGDTVTWSMEVRYPLPMKLTGKATVSGDTIKGGVTAGAFGTFPLSGKRVG